jgi:hypothetical protein
MMKGRRWILFGCAVCVGIASAGEVKRIYVSPRGDDAASGSWWHPFATFERAQEAVKQAREASDAAQPERIEVLFRGGTYTLEKPVILRPENGGTTACPVVYRARGGGAPVFSGSRAITGWTVRPDGAWAAQLPEVKAGAWNFSQLFVNGERRFRPRLPKQGYFTTAGDFGKSDAGFAGFCYTNDDVSASWATCRTSSFTCCTYGRPRACAPRRSTRRKRP